MVQIKRDPVHKKTMETRKRFVEYNFFDSEEALAAAIKKERFLFERMLQDRQHFSDNDDDGDEIDIHHQFKKQ